MAKEEPDRHIPAYRRLEKPLECWDDLYRFYQETFGTHDGEDSSEEWLFRGDKPGGEKSLGDAFRCSLEKAFDIFGTATENRGKIERHLIPAFRRQASLHSDASLENWLACLALMRHHGVPTRLLDWTYSFFVAVYFAVNRAESNCVVWALDGKWLHRRNEQYEEEFIQNHGSECTRDRLRTMKEGGRGQFDSHLVKHLIDNNPDALIYAVNPYFLHERLSVQRGVLLCPGDMKRSWGENLLAMLNGASDNDGPVLWRIPIAWNNKKSRNAILRWLYEMNISQATLFPGLDGFAESLRTRIAHPPYSWLQ